MICYCAETRCPMLNLAQTLKVMFIVCFISRSISMMLGNYICDEFSSVAALHDGLLGFLWQKMMSFN